MEMIPLSSVFYSSADGSFSSPPSYTPGTPASPSYYYGPTMARAPFFLDFGVGSEFCCRPSSPDYTPSSPPRRAASPDYTPSSPPRRAASPDYTPSTPPRRAASPDYTPSTPPRRPLSPEYTPLSPPRRAASPDYTPSTPPPSPQVSDAESRMSPPPRRHHPYQRSGASSCSSRASRICHGRRHRASAFLQFY